MDYCNMVPSAGSITFIEPVSQAVEDHALLPGRNQADGATLYCCSVVDVVLKYEDLEPNAKKCPTFDMISKTVLIWQR